MHINPRKLRYGIWNFVAWSYSTQDRERLPPWQPDPPAASHDSAAQHTAHVTASSSPWPEVHSPLCSTARRFPAPAASQKGVAAKDWWTHTSTLHRSPLSHWTLLLLAWWSRGREFWMEGRAGFQFILFFLADPKSCPDWPCRPIFLHKRSFI